MACEEERPPLLTNLRRKSATCEGLENRESASACACEIRTRAAPVQNRDDTAVVPPVAEWALPRQISKAMHARWDFWLRK
jgi:hypothetical protein